MKGRLVGLALMVTAFLTLLACVTINVYFPEAAIKDLSKQIEDQVQKQAAEKAGQAQPETPAPAEKPKGETAGLLDSLLGVSPAWAQEVAAPEVSSPAIRRIIDSRAGRVAAVNEYKTAGIIGENNQALLEIRALDALPDLKARAEVQRLVKGENADREELFKEIAAAKNVDLAQLPKIRETYAGTMRDQARPGDWIQMPDGVWKKK